MSDPRSLVPTSLRKRLTQAVSYNLSGGWFTPEMPLQPQQQQTAGRRFDYLAGYNIGTRPRRDSGIDFQTLRNFAYYYDILRMLIERRKDQIVTFDWSVQPTDEAIAAFGGKKSKKIDVLNERAAAAQKFLKCPDGRQPWNTWLRAVLEDLLVLDAIAIWPVYMGKQLQRLEYVDPATIKIVIDESGRRPQSPWPAYQQVLHGVPTADFRDDELFYFMSNPATNRIYGLSKVEQALITIQIGLRREASQLQFFTDGNVPAALAGVPDTWNAAQIATFQSAIDSILQGDTAARRKMWFIPGDPRMIKEFRSEEATLKTPFDEWLVRLLCFVFGVSPTPFVNQVNRATAFSASEEAHEEGLGPTLMFLKDFVDTIIRRCMFLEGVEFKWGIQDETDPATQAKIDDLQVSKGLRSIDELRQRDGFDPIGVGPMVFTASGPIPLSQYAHGANPEEDGSPPEGGGEPEAKAKKPEKDTGDVDVADDSGKEKLEATKVEEGRPSREEPFRKHAGVRFAKTRRYWYALPNKAGHRGTRKTIT